MIDRRALLPVLGCVALAAVIAGELRASGPALRPMPDLNAVAEADPRVRDSALRTPTAKLLQTALARPLFNPTRRPPPREGTADFDLSDKRLTGIVIVPERRLAIFDVNGGNPLALTVSETVNGWEIESITSHEISLRSPAGTRTLQPRADNKEIARAKPLPSPIHPAARILPTQNLPDQSANIRLLPSGQVNVPVVYGRRKPIDSNQ